MSVGGGGKSDGDSGDVSRSGGREDRCSNAERDRGGGVSRGHCCGNFYRSLD